MNVNFYEFLVISKIYDGVFYLKCNVASASLNIAWPKSDESMSKILFFQPHDL